MDALFINSTTMIPLAGFAAVTFESSPAPRFVRLYSNRNFHVRVNAGDATVEDYPLRDRTDFLLHLRAGESISAIQATGEPDGTIWFSVVANDGNWHK